MRKKLTLRAKLSSVLHPRNNRHTEEKYEFNNGEDQLGCDNNVNKDEEKEKFMAEVTNFFYLYASGSSFFS
jgi:hypothetical protein